MSDAQIIPALTARTQDKALPGIHLLCSRDVAASIVVAQVAARDRVAKAYPAILVLFAVPVPSTSSAVVQLDSEVSVYQRQDSVGAELADHVCLPGLGDAGDGVTHGEGRRACVGRG